MVLADSSANFSLLCNLVLEKNIKFISRCIFMTVYQLLKASILYAIIVKGESIFNTHRHFKSCIMYLYLTNFNKQFLITYICEVNVCTYSLC